MVQRVTRSDLLAIVHTFSNIGSVHPSESDTIAAFQGEKGESQLDEKGNVFNTFSMQDPLFVHYHSHISQLDRWLSRRY